MDRLGRLGSYGGIEMVTINIEVRTYQNDDGTTDTVKLAKVLEYPGEVFTYPDTMSDTDIIADVKAKLQDRGYVV